ncbi:hypothetical protein Dda_0267 [Drechslerella dactyloides]|uniref:Uncharacterized protein n=1 Tax=Drechslerella dactyloides TaxID=74499 RepID=A0AAD6J4L8_DREDA|nr:hypothetical protein Dda_0267 [Drechslerella dactyloides]
MDDDYDSGNDVAVTTAAEPLSRRKRKRAKREAEVTPAKKPRQSPDVDTSTRSTNTKKTNATKTSKRTAKTRANGNVPDTSSIDESIAGMDGRMMADFVAQRIQRANKDLSFVELGDRVLPESVYIDTSACPARSLSSLCDYMEKCAYTLLHNVPIMLTRSSTVCTKKGQSSISHLKSSPKAPGSPHTLVIAPAALRAADLVRILRKYQTADAAVAKFFAKHVKLSEATEYAAKTRIGIAVGTPARIVDLIRDGSLQVRYLARVVLDVSYLDAKRRGMWDIKEVQDRVVELLNMDAVRKRLEGGGGSEEDKRGVMFF